MRTIGAINSTNQNNNYTFDGSFDPCHEYLQMIFELNKSLLTSEQEKELFERIALGDEAAKREVIESNLKLVVSIVKKRYGNNQITEDLIQEGNIGLMIAVERFDISKGYKFSTYATWWIIQRISYYEHKNNNIVEFPYHYKTEYVEYNKAVTALQYELKREPTEIEVADYLDKPLSHIMKVKKFFSKHLSLDQPFNDQIDVNLIEFVKDETKDIEADFFKDEMKKEIDELFNLLNLTSKEIEIIKLRFGFDTLRPLTLEEIGERYGLTKQRIKQIEIKALNKIKGNKKVLYRLGEYLYDQPTVNEKKVNELLKESIRERTKYSKKTKAKKGGD